MKGKAKGTTKNVSSETKVKVADSLQPAAKPACAKKFASSAKVPLSGGYKDPYSKTLWPSKEEFYQMKLKHKNSNFTLLDVKLADVVKKGQKTAKVDVVSLGIKHHVDWRLPKYCLGFIAGGDQYRITPIKVGEKKSHLIEFQMDKKEV